jgi:hypothetical protein
MGVVLLSSRFLYKTGAIFLRYTSNQTTAPTLDMHATPRHI